MIFYGKCMATFAHVSAKRAINSDLELDDTPQSWTLRSLATVMWKKKQRFSVFTIFRDTYQPCIMVDKSLEIYEPTSQ